jgi:hypothetical protein
MQVFHLLSLISLCGALSLELVAYATDAHHKGVWLLNQTAQWHRWSPLHIIGTQKGFNTHALVDKLRALRRFSKGWPDNTILVFVDGYDVIMNNGPTELETAFLASGKRIIIASELGCCCDKATVMLSGLACHRYWPHIQTDGSRQWLNSGVIVGYARDIQRFMKLAWKEYMNHQSMYQAYTDQQVLCFLMSDGSSIWTRAAVGIDHKSELALTTYGMDIRLGQIIGTDDIGRIVFSNRTIPPIIHFNGPKQEKAAQIAYALSNFPLLWFRLY